MKITRRPPGRSFQIKGVRPANSNRRNPAATRAFMETNTADEYDFLLDANISREQLTEARKLAMQWKAPVHDVLISKGWITQADYTRALSRFAGVNYLQTLQASQLDLPNIPNQLNEGYRAGLFPGKSLDGGPVPVILASSAPSKPSALKSMIKRLGCEGERIYLVSTHQLRHAITAIQGSVLTSEAIYGIENRIPGCSARKRLTGMQYLVMWTLISGVVACAYINFNLTCLLLGIVFSLLFLPVVCLRTVTCYYAWRRSIKSTTETQGNASWWRSAAANSNEATLPVYTILVPIFREHTVLKDLTDALLALDYPGAKLDIKLIFEECDLETIQAARSLQLPDHIEFIIVPDSQPRTKPKALNYALLFARGDYAVIYDAEDRPSPDQLRKAVSTFRLAPESVACLQARLSFYNATENWLTRQFEIEYSALFGGILPALQNLDFPMPLGGTSNHFRMSALLKAGAWDAFNVTEDADLGMRLYRAGYTCRVLDSVTWEEATCTYKAWIPQRTRWLKGWMQTYMVHMRHPVKLYKQLGRRGFLGFQVMIGGFLASAFIHPLFLAHLAYICAVEGTLWPKDFWSSLSLFNLIFGYGSAMALGALITWKSGMKKLIPWIISMPFFWIGVSIAAYRALWQLINKPFLWEKTKHGVTSVPQQKQYQMSSNPMAVHTKG